MPKKFEVKGDDEVEELARQLREKKIAGSYIDSIELAKRILGKDQTDAVPEIEEEEKAKEEEISKISQKIEEEEKELENIEKSIEKIDEELKREESLTGEFKEENLVEKGKTEEETSEEKNEEEISEMEEESTEIREDPLRFYKPDYEIAKEQKPLIELLKEAGEKDIPLEKEDSEKGEDSGDYQEKIQSEETMKGSFEEDKAGIKEFEEKKDKILVDDTEKNFDAEEQEKETPDSEEYKERSSNEERVEE